MVGVKAVKGYNLWRAGRFYYKRGGNSSLTGLEILYLQLSEGRSLDVTFLGCCQRPEVTFFGLLAP